MSDGVWQAIIAALLTVYLEWSRQRAAIATKAVKTDLLASNAEQSAALAVVASNVEVVHKATNSIRIDLVDATDRAARAEGKAEGKAEAEAKNPHQGG